MIAKICHVESLHCDRQPVLHALQVFTRGTRAQEFNLEYLMEKDGKSLSVRLYFKNQTK